ncbi:MAG: hypothetical protein ACREUZ_12215 [Burkholderiales bacterium]
MKHLNREELGAGLDRIRTSPPHEGILDLIVRRPNVGLREVLETGVLDLAAGLVGDSWLRRGSSRAPDGAAHPDMQLNIMSSRVIDLIPTLPSFRRPMASCTSPTRGSANG